MAKQLFIVLVFLVLAARAAPGHSKGDPIQFTQAASGVVTASLVGTVDVCGGDHIYPMAPASVSASANAFEIISAFAIVDPPPCPFPPLPYAVDAALGTPTDGTYSVVWKAGPLITQGAFVVRAGLLLAFDLSIPALERWALLVLAALIGAAGALHWRRNAPT